MRVPLAIVDACLAMLPRLSAEEAITTVNRIGVGTGSVSTDTARSLTRAWTTTAHPHAKRAQPAGPKDLAALGIRYIVEPPRGQ